MSNNKLKKFKLTFLLDRSNNWIEKFLLSYNFSQKKKYRIKITKNHKSIKNEDLVFILSYTKILPESFLKKNKLNLIVHASRLPKDRGFAPVQYQVLRGKNNIDISLLIASKNVDTGDIFLRQKFKLNKNDLSEEIREKQAKATFDIIKKFLNQYPNIKSFKQKGKSTFNKRRYSDSNKLNVHKSLKSQFNILRIWFLEFPTCLFRKFIYFKLTILKLIKKLIFLNLS